jgi:hypothetical protein
MKTNKLSWVWIVMVLFIFACEDIKRGKLIVGNWGGAEWLVDGKPSTQDPKTTSFTFTDKGDYTYQNGGSVEKGTFKVSEGKLFTTPTGEQEMAVEIEKLTNDSLVFDMNRGGQLEVLTLIRKK